MLMVTMGARQSMGLFVSPMNISTGLGVVTISFAMAINQFVWGAVQPFTGALADRYGAGRVLVAGVLIFALGSALTPEVTTSLGLVLTIGLLSAVGSGAVSFSVLIGAVSRRVPVEASWHGRGRDQRRQLIRAVCFRAPAAGADLSVRLDGCDVVAGGHHSRDTSARACHAWIANVLPLRWLEQAPAACGER